MIALDTTPRALGIPELVGWLQGCSRIVRIVSDKFFGYDFSEIGVVGYDFVGYDFSEMAEEGRGKDRGGDRRRGAEQRSEGRQEGERERDGRTEGASN